MTIGRAERDRYVVVASADKRINSGAFGLLASFRSGRHDLPRICDAFWSNLIGFKCFIGIVLTV